MRARPLAIRTISSAGVMGTWGADKLTFCAALVAVSQVDRRAALSGRACLFARVPIAHTLSWDRPAV